MKKRLRTKSGLYLSLTALLLVFLVTSPVFCNGTYTTYLPQGYQNSCLFGINNAGKVAGVAWNNNPWVGFTSVSGTYSMVPATQPYQESVLYSINNSGVVIGDMYGPSGVDPPSVGFVYQNGSYSTISPSGYSYTHVVDINNSGTVIGHSSGNGILGFAYKSGQYTTLALGYIPDGINNSDVIVGTLLESPTQFNGHYQGFIYNNGTYTTVTRPGSQYSALEDINDLGVAIGNGFSMGADGFQHNHIGFIYNNGSYTTVLPPGYEESSVTAINKDGVVVGTVYGSRSIGFIYSNGQYTMILPTGADESQLIAINDNGLVAGQATFNFGSDPSYVGFTYGVAAPVPIPPTVWLLGSGLLWLVGLRRKFKSYLKK